MAEKLSVLFHLDLIVAVLPTGFGKSLLFQALPNFFPVNADNNIVYYFSKLVRAL